MIIHIVIFETAALMITETEYTALVLTKEEGGGGVQ